MPIPSDEGIPSLWGLLADTVGEIIAVVNDARRPVWFVSSVSLFSLFGFLVEGN
jgi:hypothetical protein